MVSFVGSNSAARLIGLGVLASCLLFYFPHILNTPSRSTVGETSTQPLPWFNSSRYIQVRDYGNGTWPFRVFKSSKWRPPQLNITGNGGELSEGYLFFTPKRRKGQGVTMDMSVIMSQDNELIYAFDGTAGTNNFHAQTINGKSHLTIWNGLSKIGHGYGQLVIMDSNYTETRLTLNNTLNGTINMNLPEQWTKGTPPGFLDFHEQEVTDRGTVLVTAYNSTPGDLAALGGEKEGWIADSLFYEVDIVTGELLFSWSALDHFDITDSKLPLPSYMADGTANKPFDLFHINSIQAIGDDAFLVSSRHMWACYLISRKTGNVIWTLKGEGSGGDFGPLPPEAQFRWQHNARAYNVSATGMTISLFDNHNTDDDYGVTPSKALVLRLSLPPDKKTPPVILRNLQSPEKFFAASQGSYQIDLSNSNQLLSYGPVPVIQEFGLTGDGRDLRWQGRFGIDDLAQTYRVFKAPWHGTPLETPPSVVIEAKSPLLKGYVSWNGATDVEAWNVYHVEPGVGLTPLGQALPRGFETVIEISGRFNHTRCIMVAAVQGGKEIRQSNTACLNKGNEW
ncbi:Fc.00g032750.m01.CDS01 [Cosmosporella sp. VM-42]